jgi:hypothetical protein
VFPGGAGGGENDLVSGRNMKMLEKIADARGTSRVIGEGAAVDHAE